MARVLAALLTVVGVWYAAFGLSLLVNLTEVTHRWIQASGDADFRLDFEWFRTAGAGLAVLAAGLGLLSVRAAAGTISGHDEIRRHWIGLLLLAILVHVLRAFAELIGGTFSTWRLVSFASVCGLYALLWALDRPADRPRHLTAG